MDHYEKTVQSGNSYRIAATKGSFRLKAGLLNHIAEYSDAQLANSLKLPFVPVIL